MPGIARNTNNPTAAVTTTMATKIVPVIRHLKTSDMLMSSFEQHALR
jgi:hypothetical protein